MPTANEQRDSWGLAQGSSAGETQRALLSPEEIMMRYATDKMLVLKQGIRPIEADRVPYFNDRSLAGSGTIRGRGDAAAVSARYRMRQVSACTAIAAAARLIASSPLGAGTSAT